MSCECKWDFKKVIVHRLGKQFKAWRKFKIERCEQHKKNLTEKLNIRKKMITDTVPDPATPEERIKREERAKKIAKQIGGKSKKKFTFIIKK